MSIIIYKGDSSQTRKQKKSHKRSLKSKAKKKEKLQKLYKETIAFKTPANERPVVYEKNIELFCRKNDRVQPTNKYSKPQIKLTDSFNLYQNPNLVLTNLVKLLKAAKENNRYDAILRYKGGFSFGALYLIDMVCWAIAQGKKATWTLDGKNLPERHSEMLSNLKSIKTHETNLPTAYIRNERVRVRHDNNQLNLQRINDDPYLKEVKEVRQMIVQAVRETTGNPDYDLDHSYIHALDGCITEQFDNIKQHVPDAEIGTLCVMYDRFAKNVSILIYNYGPTIAETLSSNRLPTHVQQMIDRIIGTHVQKKLLTRKEFTKENALTLLALQEGISSKLNADSSRGHGLIDFVENCMNLSDDTRIVIVSGKTAIRIDNTYKVRQENALGRLRRILAFNSTNNIFDKPDIKHIVNMGVYFPGVLIETVIPLKIA